MGKSRIGSDNSSFNPDFSDLIWGVRPMIHPRPESYPTAATDQKDSIFFLVPNSNVTFDLIFLLFVCCWSE
jgi:hypothetical protein